MGNSEGFNHITLALDLSLSSPGFAVLAVTSEGHPLILKKSHVKTTASKPHGYRLYEIATELSRLIVEYEPEHIVREKGFSRFPATTQALFKVVGISDYVAHVYGDEATIAELSPTTIKKIVAGSGKASKRQVEKAVREILRIDQPKFFANDDESDAAACGLAYLIKKGLIAE